MSVVERRQVLLASASDATEGTASANAAGRISGIAVPLGMMSHDLGGFVEVFDRGAFDEQARQGWATDREPVVANFQHEDEVVLGTVRAGTFRLTLTTSALAYSLDLPASMPYVLESVRRGDSAGASIEFVAENAQWSTLPDGTVLRTVLAATIHGLGIVSAPAYATASADVDTIGRTLPTRSLQTERERLRLNDRGIRLADLAIATAPTRPSMATLQREQRARDLRVKIATLGNYSNDKSRAASARGRARR